MSILNTDTSYVNNYSTIAGKKPENERNGRENVEFVNRGEEDEMELYGYRRDSVRTAVTWFMIAITFGCLRLIFHWKPQWMLFCTHRTCKLEQAEKVLLVDSYNQVFVETVVTKSGEECLKKLSHDGDTVVHSNSQFIKYKSAGIFEPCISMTYFENKKIRYFWQDDEKTYAKVTGLDKDIPCSYFYTQNGINDEEQIKRRFIFGRNEIVVEVQSILEILFNEVLGPFYVFQVFSIALWCFEDYIYYASCIVVMSALSLATSVIQIRRNQKQLRDTVQGIDTVTVCRGEELYEEIESSKLVPGDVIVIAQCGGVMQCDAVLIAGNAIVNESMLTGESVPVTKTPLPYSCRYELYHSKEHAKHTLFCGTKVIQTRFYDGAKVKAVVIRTGYLTSKGELVRSIMFPKPVDFKFNQHISKFIQFLACLAAIGFTYTVVIKVQRKVPVTDIMLKALDLITIVIPPALPAAMSIGVVYAQSRLRQSDIYCISPRSINISGCINCVCFDKTGTLTEDDLSFVEVAPVNEDTIFDAPLQSPSTTATGPLITCLATCHSLTLIDGQLAGDPLDQKMFAATEWQLEEPAVSDENKFDLLAPTVVTPKVKFNENSDDLQVGILRQFPFSSNLQRMSVVTRTVNGTQFVLYAKGSPEMISSLCKTDTLPANFTDVLMAYTEKGYRVLALAYRPLLHISYAKLQRIAREDVEKDLTFLGLLVMGNMLKPQTTQIIKCLSNANTRSIMVTGDNMLTALSVARDCSMIDVCDRVIVLEADDESETATLSWKYANRVRNTFDVGHDFVNVHLDDSATRLHVAVTGKTFRILKENFPELLKKVAVKGTVFARMAPEQKQQLVELLQELGYFVGMCGDGANDCGALKAAHAGVSLSEAEASVASPFTSKTANISCIPVLIREGRASLVTAFGILKYMACYSLTQFLSVILLYTMYSNLTDMQFLYEDLFLISLFFVLFGKTGAHEQLAKHPPPSSLIGITPLSSILLQFLLIATFQVSALLLLWTQSWYKPHNPLSNHLQCHDNYAVFSISVFQYITLAVVFSKGAPYRQSLMSNYPFLISILLTTVATSYIIIWPHEWIAQHLELELTGVELNFRLTLLMMAFVNFLLCLFAESFVTDILIFKKLRMASFLKSFSHKEQPYKRLLRECSDSISWLPCTFSEETVLNCKDALTQSLKNSKSGLNSNVRNASPESGISSPTSFPSPENRDSRITIEVLDQVNPVSCHSDNVRVDDKITVEVKTQ